MPGAPDWSGQRFLHGVTQLTAGQAGPVARGTTSVKTVMITRPGYFLELHLWNATDTVTSLPAGVQLEWLDAVTGDALETDSWWVQAGTATTPHYVFGSGPTRGGKLKISVTNGAASAVNLYYYLVLNESSFAYARHDWRTDSIFGYTIPGWTAPGTDMNADVQGFVDSSAYNASQAKSYMLPLYNGQVQLRAFTSLASNTLKVQVNPAADAGNATAFLSFDALTDATGRLQAVLALPRSQSAITLTNTAASSATVSWSTTVLER